MLKECMIAQKEHENIYANNILIKDICFGKNVRYRKGHHYGRH